MGGLSLVLLHIRHPISTKQPHTYLHGIFIAILSISTCTTIILITWLETCFHLPCMIVVWLARHFHGLSIFWSLCYAGSLHILVHCPRDSSCRVSLMFAVLSYDNIQSKWVNIKVWWSSLLEHVPVRKRMVETYESSKKWGWGPWDCLKIRKRKKEEEKKDERKREKVHATILLPHLCSKVAPLHAL